MEPEPVAAPIPMPPEPEPEPVITGRPRKRASDGLYGQADPKVRKSRSDVPKVINRMEGKLMRHEMDFNKAVEGMNDIVTVSEYFDRYIKELKGENGEILGMIIDLSTNFDKLDGEISRLDDEISRLNTKFTDEYASVRDDLQMMQQRGPSTGSLKNKSKKKKKKSKKRKSKKRKSKK